MRRLKLPIDFSDVIAVAGVAAVFWGFYSIVPAAGYIVIGILLLFVAPRLSKK